ncbi:MAG: competence/damage-inducible protein A [Bacteroidia bacterium]|nr:competence/damage-inducible protein A [Bacteroidia bacterium]
MKVNAEIITIGDEILIGQIVNTNSVWLCNKLNEMGVWVSKISTVGDNEEQINQSLKIALSSNDIVIITGGLGPTKDDITKSSLQKFFKTGLIKNKEVENHIKNMFSKIGFSYLPSNENQAYILENSKLLFNNYGTAPGMWIDTEKKSIIVLPGVPDEMKGIMNDFVFDKIKIKFKLPFILHKTIIVSGIAESLIADTLSEIENQLPKHIKLAYLPEYGKVKLRLTGLSSEHEMLIAELKKYCNLIIEKLPKKNIVSNEDLKYEEIICKIFKEKKITLATAESCTGGYISHLITSVPGSSEFFKGSVVSYDNSIKTNVLGVEKDILANQGAVSEECVIHMAEGVLKKFEVDFSVSTSGIAGPGGETIDKPVGLVWIAVSSKNKTISKKYRFSGTRFTVIQKTTNAVLELLRQVVLNIE